MIFVYQLKIHERNTPFTVDTAKDAITINTIVPLTSTLSQQMQSSNTSYARLVCKQFLENFAHFLDVKLPDAHGKTSTFKLVQMNWIIVFFMSEKSARHENPALSDSHLITVIGPLINTSKQAYPCTVNFMKEASNN